MPVGPGLKRAMALAGRALAAALFLSLAACSGMFFYPQKEFADLSYLSRYQREDVEVKSPDGTVLRGFSLSGPNPPRATIVFFHGNAENISTHLRNVVWLAEAGYRILAVDYRGYGRSDGEATIEGVNADALAVLDYAFTAPEIDHERIAVLGQSLGGALAIRSVAASPHREKVRLLVADSAFAGYRKILREKISASIIGWPFAYPLSYTVDDEFSPEKWIGKLGGAHILLIHSESDPIVPFSHSQILYEAAREPKGHWTARGVSHGEAFALPELRAQLLKVLDEKFR